MVDAILKRSSELKQALSDFVFDAEGELAIALETFSAQQMSKSGDKDMNQRNLPLDRFIVDGRVGDKTPIDLFLESETELSQSDRDLVESWKRSIIGLFAIAQVLEDGFELINQTTAKSYIVKPNDPKTWESMSRYKVGEILLAQIAPVTDEYWMFSSKCITLGKLGKPKLAVAIGNFKQVYNNYLYSDAPELLEEAWRSVEKYHTEFVDFFGSDEVTLPGYQLNKKLAEFQEQITEKRLDESGFDRSKSLEELAEGAGFSQEEIKSVAESMGVDSKESENLFNGKQTAKMIQPKIELPADLKKAERVTVISHPRWGQMFLPTYCQFKNILETDEAKNVAETTKLVRHYLESPQINIFIWQRLAQQYPTQPDNPRRAVMDSVEAIAISLICTTLVLILLREINLETSLKEALGKIIFESVPFAIRVALARSIMSGQNGKDEQNLDNSNNQKQSSKKSTRNHFLGDIGATLIGAIFIAFNIAPTDEISMLSTAISEPWLLGIVAASLIISYGIVFVCDLIIAKKQEIEFLMAAGLSKENSQIVGNNYLVMGTLERQDWKQGNQGTLPPSEIIERMSIFKDQ